MSEGRVVAGCFGAFFGLLEPLEYILWGPVDKIASRFWEWRDYRKGLEWLNYQVRDEDETGV